MPELETNSQEPLTPEHAYEELLALEPKLLTYIVPDNASIAQQAFIAGSSEKPDHTYSLLATVDNTAVDKIRKAGKYFETAPGIKDDDRVLYEQFVDSYVKKTELMQQMYEVQSNPNAAAEAAFMRNNIELYGEPNESTYLSLLSEKLVSIDNKSFEGEAERLRTELHDMLPSQLDTQDAVERFKPSQDTVTWMHDVATELYGPWLKRMPTDKATYNPQDLKQLFEDVLREEIGEAAEDWRVDIESAKAINVKSPEKRVVIPQNRAEVSAEAAKKLLVHEIGVHVLRSLAGESTHLGPLRNGLDEYYDVEEGLGKVMEQAIVGRFSEVGQDHYITAGYAYFEHGTFRDTYEMKWRLSLLSGLAEGQQPTEGAVAKAKKAAYDGTMRIFRGTDSLPWFKDLAYFNGASEAWRYLEQIKGDDLQLALLLQGKVNASKQHQRVMLEASSR